MNWYFSYLSLERSEDEFLAQFCTRNSTETASRTKKPEQRSTNWQKWWDIRHFKLDQQHCTKLSHIHPEPCVPLHYLHHPSETRPCIAGSLRRWRWFPQESRHNSRHKKQHAVHLHCAWNLNLNMPKNPMRWFYVLIFGIDVVEEHRGRRY